MHSAKELRAALGSARGAGALRQLYGNTPAAIEHQRTRYALLLDRFASLFAEDRDIRIFSTPGRTEIGGNHTDHNAGRVLAAAVNLDAVAVAARSSDGRIVVESEGYPRQEIRVDDLARRDSEAGTAQALTRGVAARMRELGHEVGGFHACVTSSVLKGSGLSSSASYEVLIATIINGLYNAGRIGDLDVAMISQHAENRYFGKPCGLTEDYAAIEREMKDAARALGDPSGPSFLRRRCPGGRTGRGAGGWTVRRFPPACHRKRPQLVDAAAEPLLAQDGRAAGHLHRPGGEPGHPRWRGSMACAWRRFCRHHPGIRPRGEACGISGGHARSVRLLVVS